MNPKWEVANDSPVWMKPGIVYFLTRTVDGKREDLRNKLGILRTFRVREKAQAKADALNSGNEPIRRR